MALNFERKEFTSKAIEIPSELIKVVSIRKGKGVYKDSLVVHSVKPKTKIEFSVGKGSLMEDGTLLLFNEEMETGEVRKYTVTKINSRKVDKDMKGSVEVAKVTATELLEHLQSSN